VDAFHLIDRVAVEDSGNRLRIGHQSDVNGRTELSDANESLSLDFRLVGDVVVRRNPILGRRLCVEDRRTGDAIEGDGAAKFADREEKEGG
jgi:hypothetical protein